MSEDGQPDPIHAGFVLEGAHGLVGRRTFRKLRSTVGDRGW
jgi:hypothetical protein